MLSQMSRKKAIRGIPRMKMTTVRVQYNHSCSYRNIFLLESPLFWNTSLRHRQSKSHRQTDYIEFAIWVLSDKSSYNTVYFLSKSTKKNTSQNFLTPKKSQNYWFQTPKNLKFGLALDAGRGFVTGCPYKKFNVFFCCIFSSFFVISWAILQWSRWGTLL